MSENSFWSGRKIRKIRGSRVSFYRRYEGGDYIVDFSAHGQRVQRSSGTSNLSEAERAAERWLRELWEESVGLAGDRRERVRVAAPVSTVGEIAVALDGGVRVFGRRTAVTYLGSLRRLARLVEAEEPEAVSLAAVLDRALVERFYSAGQGRSSVDWTGEYAANRGLNTCLRNVRSLFGKAAVELKWSAEAKLPPLEEFRRVPYLHAPIHGFEPWDEDAYQAMCAAAERLRGERPELWLVNAMLRRLGLRVSELIAARREWIEQRDGEAWLVLKSRPEFALLKNGSPRRLTLDAELREILLAREGWLVGEPGWSEDRRKKLVEREHSVFLRQFIPDRKKSNHELRMYAASLVYRREREAGRDGLSAAAYFLGDSIQTTKDYYATWLGGSAVLDAAAVAG